MSRLTKGPPSPKAPLVNELTSDGSASFHFVDAPCEAVPPVGFEDFFGAPPYYRFIEPDDDGDDDEKDKPAGPGGRGNGRTDVLTRIRDFPAGATPEDTMRELLKEGVAGSARSTAHALAFLDGVLASADGPFDGVLGYSEGATVAGTLLLAQQQQRQRAAAAAAESRSPAPPRLACAVFFAGWPPLDPASYAMVLADESDLMLELPTCHIIGSLDPYVAGSLALYNTCDPDKAYMFDHGKGHTLPREKGVIKELGDVIRSMMAEVAAGSPGSP